MDQFVSHQVSKAEIARLREDYNLVRYDLVTILCLTCLSVNTNEIFVVESYFKRANRQ